MDEISELEKEIREELKKELKDNIKQSLLEEIKKELLEEYLLKNKGQAISSKVNGNTYSKPKHKGEYKIILEKTSISDYNEELFKQKTYEDNEQAFYISDIERERLKQEYLENLAKQKKVIAANKVANMTPYSEYSRVEDDFNIVSAITGIGIIIFIILMIV